jgi:hypothetical protein
MRSRSFHSSLYDEDTDKQIALYSVRRGRGEREKETERERDRERQREMYRKGSTCLCESLGVALDSVFYKGD